MTGPRLLMRTVHERVIAEYQPDPIHPSWLVLWVDDGRVRQYVAKADVQRAVKARARARVKAERLDGVLSEVEWRDEELTQGGPERP